MMKIYIRLSNEVGQMGIKGLIRDIIMFYVGIQLVLGNADPFTMGMILIIVATLFTILAWIIFFKAR